MDFFTPGTDLAPFAGVVVAGTFGGFCIGIFLAVFFTPETLLAPFAGEVCFGAFGLLVPFMIMLQHFCG